MLRLSITSILSLFIQKFKLTTKKKKNKTRKTQNSFVNNKQQNKQKRMLIKPN